jgi:chaperonin GroEL
MGKMTALLRPTLGPISGIVAIEGPNKTSSPEILGAGATIARRTIQLEDPYENMGAMIIRQLAWQVDESAGGGATTAAIMCYSMTRAAHKHIMAGGNPMSMRPGLEKGVHAARACLRSQMIPIVTPADLAHVAQGTPLDSRLARMVGEIVEQVGSDGSIRIEDGVSSRTEYDFIQGSRWEAGALSSVFLPDGQSEVVLRGARILVTSVKPGVSRLLSLVESCLSAGERNLVIVAPSLDNEAISFLVGNRDRGVLEGVIAVKAPGSSSSHDDLLQDLATITGARLVDGVTDSLFGQLSIADLGTARQVWATQGTFGLFGGGGSLGLIRKRFHDARVQFEATSHEHHAIRNQIETRMGNLTGLAAIIRVGAATNAERRFQRSRMESAVDIVRAASRDGVVPGAGTSFLRCRPALQQLQATLQGDEAYGVSILDEGLGEPLRTIASNAGFDPEVTEDRSTRLYPDCVFDARSGTWEPFTANGIVDPLSVVVRAMEASVSAAIMAMTTEALVRSRRPQIAERP